MMIVFWNFFKVMQYGRHLENLHLLADFDEIWLIGSMKGPNENSILKKCLT